MFFNPLRILAVLLDPQNWITESVEMAKASPILVPIYYSVFDWINAHHHHTHPMASKLQIALALDITLLVHCCYQIVKPYLPGKAS